MLREFTADGVRWSVWQTTPDRSVLFEAGEVDRGGRQGRSTGEVDRGGRQGRSTGEVDRRVTGWLTFMAGPNKRRYWPIPAGWQDWPEDRLRRLLREAKVSRWNG